MLTLNLIIKKTSSLTFTFFLSVSAFHICLGQSTEGQLKKEVILSKTASEDSTFQDSRPLVSENGKHLYFGRRNSIKNAGGKNDFQDVWVSSIDSTGSFGKVRSLGTTINNAKTNGIFAISPDGNEIIITNDYDDNKTAPIARSRKTNGIWSKPEPIFIDNYSNKSRFVDFHLSYKHKVLLMAVERKEGQGDQDLYISFKGENGTWNKPVNLGAAINTKAAEFAPYLSSDGRTLFFASFKEGGIGGSDIYATTRLDDSWTNWSEPKNLGPTVNTSGNENYISITSDMKQLFVETLAYDKSKRTIYNIAMQEEFMISKDILLSSK